MFDMKKYEELHREYFRKQNKLSYRRHLDDRREKARLRNQGYRQTRPEKVRAYQLKNMYSISTADYDKMFNEQEGLCAICRKPETTIQRGKLRKLIVDHDAAGRIRDLLCNRCNTALGLFHEDEELLITAVKYLRYYKK